MSFKFYRQLDAMDCGPTCLRMVAKHHGRNCTQQSLTDLCGINREGVSLLGISEAAEKIGLKTMGARLSISELSSIDLPAILHWRQYHFVVLYRIKNGRYFIADPAAGQIQLTEAEFKQHWLEGQEDNQGIALLLSPGPSFYEHQSDGSSKITWAFLLRYLVVYKKLVIQLLLGLAVGSLLQLITPFLTQSIVDTGINTRNLNFVYIILLAQGMLILGRTSVEFIRSWILLHISTRLNVSILTDFLIKLMKLPMSYFDTRMTGDIMQRMNDQKKIESFLTGQTLSVLFSVINLLIFSAVLAYYNLFLFGIFLLSNAIYTLWILLFLKRRRVLNYKSFTFSAKNQSSILELVNGMQEIKLNNCEQEKRWEWERIQARLFRFNIKTLALSQYQQGGSMFINESTNLFITFLSARAVIEDHLTLGGMMAVQYIIGQLNSPVQQFLQFIQSYQDARISLERLNEIHTLSDEAPPNQEFSHVLPHDKSLRITNLTFRYPGAGNEPVLKNINLLIPQGKTTAIVGMSGCGKTTILKLLMRFYKPEEGTIHINEQSLDEISFKTWRANCGVVMQDGFIFSDTIEHNIAVGGKSVNAAKLNHAIRVANLDDFINRLPLGLKTKIGAEGNGISQGQRQRLLIARAVYKDPQYLFFDEATNALDSNNERQIMDNLSGFFKDRTVVIVAHRLSTVSNADHIIVLDKGGIKEQGTHQQLTALEGKYFELVKNQLSIGT